MENSVDLEAKNFITEKLTADFKLQPLTGDAGTRQYFKINNELAEEHILCAYKKDELTSFDYFLNVNNLFTNNKIRTPQILHTNKHLGLMILEDLGNKTLEDKFKEKNNTSVYYSSLDEMIKIQNIKPTPNSIAHSYSFTLEKFNWELNFSFKHLRDLYSLDLDAINQVALQKEFHDISTHLVNLPQVVTHRDYHSRNIISKGDKIYIIDFQDARMGCPFYDLTSLVEDTYTGLSPSQKKDLIGYYKKHSSLNFDKNFEENYNIQALQRSLKACGSFARLKNVIGTDRYLMYLKPSILNIQNYLTDLKAFPEISKLVALCALEEGL